MVTPSPPPHTPHTGSTLRLVLIQILLQQRGIKLNPVTTLYYIAPACFCFLLVPFCFLELPKLLYEADWTYSPGLLLLSATVAFCECGISSTCGPSLLLLSLTLSLLHPSYLPSPILQASTWRSSCSSARALPLP